VNSRRSVTLTDVARRAGVSRTTASYILNDRASQMRIAPATVTRVRRAVDELGYRPNRSAQNLRTSTTKTIGVLSDHVASGHYASHMLTGASAAARLSDHLLVIAESEGDPELEALLIEDMLDRQVDGIVYVRMVTSRVVVPPSLRDRQVVLLNCVDEADAFPALLPDEHGGGRTAADVLVRAGVAEDVYVVGEDPTPQALAGPLRLAGIRERLDEAGFGLAGVVPCPWGVREAHEAVHHWLMSGVRPSALVCLNDRVAMGAYQALATHGLDVPGDVSVVSFDGSELATWLRPAVTSVELPFAVLGERAVEALTAVERLEAGTVRVAMPLLPGGSVLSSTRTFDRGESEPLV
jgi:LacI family transcriptional regulator